MKPHDEFLELAAASTAGELSASERVKLESHLALCLECRQAAQEFELAARQAPALFAAEFSEDHLKADPSWSLEQAEQRLFNRLEKEPALPGIAGSRELRPGPGSAPEREPAGWREAWIALAAVVILVLALGTTLYRTGRQRSPELPGQAEESGPGSVGSLEEEVSDRGHERSQLLAKLELQDRTMAELRRELEARQRELEVLKAGRRDAAEPGEARQRERTTSQGRVEELEKSVESLEAERAATGERAAVLEARVEELSQLAREREQALDRKEGELGRQKELLDHDRDIRELMGARELYIAEVHDVSRSGQTDRTYGRLFYTKGKSLIFYAYDLDAQPGVGGTSTFQAWGRRGPDREQALSLGLFYEDNASKKRWVLKASDTKTLEDIDAVFVTVEPSGGSHHPSGKQLLFAYLRVSPNHP